jgi:hypothetical protein
MTETLRPLLEGGDRRSTGRADEAAEAVLADGSRAGELWALIEDRDPLVRMRAADALEKASRSRPELLLPHKQALLDGRLDDGTPEVRWHLFAMAARLPLSGAEAERLMFCLDAALHEDSSRIVKVMALQAAADLAAAHPPLRRRFAAMLDFARSSPWPAVAARARKLMNLARRSGVP